MRSVALDGRERALTLTTRGHHLLEAHRRDRDGTREQAFYCGVNRPRELSHDVQLYRAYLRQEERLRDQGAEIRRVVLDTTSSANISSGCRRAPRLNRWGRSHHGLRGADR